MEQSILRYAFSRKNEALILWKILPENTAFISAEKWWQKCFQWDPNCCTWTDAEHGLQWTASWAVASSQQLLVMFIPV